MQVIFDALREIDSIVHRGRNLSESVTRARIKHYIYRALHKHYNPITKNILSYLSTDLPIGSFKTLHEHILARIQRLKATLAASAERTSSNTRDKTRGACAVTFGDNVLFRRALSSARRVNVLAGGPDNPGRELVSALSNHAVWYPDVAARAALHDADLALVPCVAIAPDTIISPVGGELLAELAHNRALPVYVVAQGLQYDPHVFSHIDELPGYASKPIVRNCYQAGFEKVNPLLVSGIISEFGVHPFAHFIEESSRNYPWLFIH